MHARLKRRQSGKCMQVSKEDISANEWSLYGGLKRKTQVHAGFKNTLPRNCMQHKKQYSLANAYSLKV